MKKNKDESDIALVLGPASPFLGNNERDMKYRVLLLLCLFLQRKHHMNTMENTPYHPHVISISL